MRRLLSLILVIFAFASFAVCKREPLDEGGNINLDLNKQNDGSILAKTKVIDFEVQYIQSGDRHNNG